VQDLKKKTLPPTYLRDAIFKGLLLNNLEIFTKWEKRCEKHAFRSLSSWYAQCSYTYFIER